jgi:deoxyribose-phosphate aldolase
VSMVDLTTLEGKDTPGKVASLCHTVLTPHDEGNIPPAAVVCLYPAMVKHAKKHVSGTSAKVASVNKEGFTPLHSAPIAIARDLLSKGADVNASATSEASAL